MDMIRYAACNNDSMKAAADSIISIPRKLMVYLRDPEMAKKLIVRICSIKTKKGRLFSQNKDDDVILGWNRRWTMAELNTLKYALLFIVMYYPILRYDMASPPTSSSNSQKVKRVFVAMVIEQELDCLYLHQFKSRNAKAFKDKMILCAGVDANKADKLVVQIKDNLINKLNMNNQLKNQQQVC